MIGYILIGIIAFALGISVTLFCFQLKGWQNDNDSRNHS